MLSNMAGSENGTVLIVEDEGIVAAELQMHIENLGHRVIGIAESAQQAIEVALTKQPELLLVDIRLRGLNDGIDAAVEIRRHIDVAVIFLTAYADEETVNRAKLAMPYGYLVKPIRSEELNTAVKLAISPHRIKTHQRILLQALQATQAAIVITDALQADYPIIEVNLAFQRLTGYSEKEVLGKNCRFLNGPETDIDVCSQLRTAINGAESAQVKILNYRKDGTTFWNNLIISPVFNSAGQVIRFINVFTDITATEILQKQVADSEKQFRTIAKTIQDVFLLRNDGFTKMFYISPAFERIWGRSVESVMEQPSLMLDAIHPEDKSQVLARFAIMEKEVTCIETEFRIIRPDGKIRWILGRCYPVHDDSQELHKWAGVFTDLTETKQMKALAETSQTLAQLTLDAFADPVCVLNEQGIIVAANRVWRVSSTVNGGDSEMFCEGVHYLSICDAVVCLQGEDAKKMAAGIQAIFSGEIEEFHMEYPGHSPGQQRWFLAKVSRTRRNKEQALVVIVHFDITERICSEQHLASEKMFSDSILQGLPGIMLLFDREGRPLRWNAEVEHLFIDTDTEFSNANPLQIISDKDKALATQRFISIFEKQKSELTANIVTKDGKELTYYFTGHFVMLQQRPCALVIGIDISERERIKDELEDTFCRMRALTKRIVAVQEEMRLNLARELHDEVGQGLTAAKIHIQALQRQYLSKETCSIEHLNEGLNSVELALNQVRILSTDLRPPQLDDFGLSVALRSLFNRQVKLIGCALYVDDHCQQQRFPASIELACYRIAQEALTNIMRHAKASKVFLSLSKVDQELILQVRDNGVGFVVKKTKEISDVTYGLGLLGMEERVAATGGAIQIYSELDRGTEVRATFPLGENYNLQGQLKKEI
jgi:PAS domain S-box-containing protein